MGRATARWTYNWKFRSLEAWKFGLTSQREPQISQILADLGPATAGRTHNWKFRSLEAWKFGQASRCAALTKNTKDHKETQRVKPSTAKIHKEGDPRNGPCVRKSARPARGSVGAWRASHATLWFWEVPRRSHRPIGPMRPICPTTTLKSARMEPQISQICCRLRACYRTLDCQFVLENLAAKPPSYMSYTSYMSYRAVLQSANQLISRALRRSARVFVEKGRSVLRGGARRPLRGRGGTL